MSGNNIDKNIPLVSVVITTYKRPVDILMRSVKSVLNQTYPNLEVIIVNDYPDKESAECIRAAIQQLNDKRVQYYVNAENKGACYSRNFGADKANGEFLAFLDDDDTWDGNKLEMHISYFDDPDVALVYSGMKKLFRTGVKEVLPNVDDDKAYPRILLGNFIGGCSVPVIRTSAFLDVGKFDEAFQSSQDIDLWIRLLARYKVKSIKTAYTNYYYSKESITRNIARQLQGFDLILEKYSDQFDKLPDYRLNRIERECALCVEKGTKKMFDNYFEKYKNAGGRTIKIIPKLLKSLTKRIISGIGLRDI